MLASSARRKTDLVYCVSQQMFNTLEFGWSINKRINKVAFAAGSK
jgi:hypothetical protein